MATQKQITDFIMEIAPCAQVAYKNIGKVLPSVCIGMACVESAYGTAGSCKFHSYLGQKVGSGKTAVKYWTGTFFTSKTKEEYSIGHHTTITSAFRSYPSMQDCVNNYYELLNTSLYSKVYNGSNSSEQMKQIKACGYMTSSTEVASVLSIIDKYDLIAYDTPPVLKKGDRGTYVFSAQAMLNNLIKFGLALDGIYGPKTEQAVIALQGYYNMEKTGIIDYNTWQKLYRG